MKKEVVTIDLIVVKSGESISRAIQNFDIDICKCSWDGLGSFHVAERTHNGGDLQPPQSLGRINKIEQDVQKERKEIVAKFKASVLLAQTSLVCSGWEFKELRLGCSNKERSIIERRYEERLSTAKVAWEAAQHESKSTFRAAVNSRLAKAKADEKVARKRCKSALKAAEKAYRTEASLAKKEQKDGLSRPRQDVCKNWDGSESRLDRILDNVVSSGHASMHRMESINKRMSRAQTLSLNRHGCSEEGIAEIEMMEEMQLCQGVLTDIRRMQLASSSGKSPPRLSIKEG